MTHLLSWENKRCIKCGIDAKKLAADNTIPCEIQFKYSIPMVANITVKTPLPRRGPGAKLEYGCRHDDINWMGKCIYCGIVT